MSQKKTKITGLRIKIPQTVQVTDKKQWIESDLNVKTDEKLAKLSQNS